MSGKLIVEKSAKLCKEQRKTLFSFLVFCAFQGILLREEVLCTEIA